MKVDLSGDTTGVKNIGSKSAAVALNWWGSNFGPTGTGASTTVGLVDSSPWLGDSASLTLSIPDALGFDGSSRYAVTPSTAAHNPNLSISGLGSQSPLWTVTPTGTILFVVSGQSSSGSVAINGEPGSDAFKMVTNPAESPGASGAVYFVGNDSFAGAKVLLKGNIGLAVNAKGTSNSFDVSAWTDAATLAAPAGTGTVTASKNAGYTLTNTAPTSTDGMNLTLTPGEIATASLTTVAGGVNVIVDSSAFTGVTNLTAAGPGSAILYGGKGGATLTVSNTASGNDILIGGTGANTLIDKGTGRDILIGGGGGKTGNTLYNNGNDILIGGMTSYDGMTAPNIAALDAILAEWSSKTDSLDLRVGKINGGMIPGGYALNPSTVRYNGNSNFFSAGTQAHQNWYLYTSKDSVTMGDGRYTIIPS